MRKPEKIMKLSECTGMLFLIAKAALAHNGEYYAIVDGKRVQVVAD